MTISIECDHCLAKFRVQDQLAGKRVRCKTCSEPIRVPGGETADPPVVRRRKPVLDNLDDWDDSDSEMELELPKPRVKPKKKKRRTASQFDFQGVAASILNQDIGGLLLKLGAVFILALFVVGIWSPSAASVFLLLVAGGAVFTMLGSWISIYVIAAREHVMCFLFCVFVPFYYLWFVLSRWDRTALSVSLFFGAWVGGWALTFGGLHVYRTVGVRPQPGDMHFGAAPIAQPGGPLQNSPENPNELFPVKSVPVPKIELGDREVRATGPGLVRRVRVAGENTSGPGILMNMRLHLPDGQHQLQSLPCILIAPAGSTLLTGAELDDPDHTAETAPYVNAGYAVVEYSIDGWDPRGQPSTGAYLVFKDAQAGVVNGRNALEFVLSSVPEVNPNRIYAAGHSSAAVLALLLAEHEPRIRGCVAYAPATDVEQRLRPNLSQMSAERQFPGVYQFIQRSSPKTHAAHLNCPVFLFHAQDDTNEPISTTRAFHAQLQSLGKQSTLVEVPTGDHYNSMIQEGIPAALRWLAQLPGNR